MTAQLFKYQGSNALDEATFDAKLFSNMNCNNGKSLYVLDLTDGSYVVTTNLPPDTQPVAIAVGDVLFTPA